MSARKNIKTIRNKMPVFDTCCCCSLRTGSIIVGIIQTVLSFFLTSLGIYLLVIPDLSLLLEQIWKKLYFYNGPIIVAQNETAGPTPLNLSTSQILTIEFSILMCSVILGSSCISNVLLIIGAAKKLLYFLIPWLVLQWISLFTLMGILGVTLWQLILAGSVGRYWGLLMFGIGVLILLLIALLFVLSLYQVIRDQEVPEIRPDIELMNRQLWIPKQHRYFD